MSSVFSPMGIFSQALRSQISNLKISNLKSQISDLKSQIPNLRSQISDPKSQISNPRCQISNLRLNWGSLRIKDEKAEQNNLGCTRFEHRQTGCSMKIANKTMIFNLVYSESQIVVRASRLHLAMKAQNETPIKKTLDNSALGQNRYPCPDCSHTPFPYPKPHTLRQLQTRRIPNKTERALRANQHITVTLGADSGMAVSAMMGPNGDHGRDARATSFAMCCTKDGLPGWMVSGYSWQCDGISGT